MGRFLRLIFGFGLVQIGLNAGNSHCVLKDEHCFMIGAACCAFRTKELNPGALPVLPVPRRAMLAPGDEDFARSFLARHGPPVEGVLNTLEFKGPFNHETIPLIDKTAPRLRDWCRGPRCIIIGTLALDHARQRSHRAS